MSDELKQQEELKRARACDPVERWHQIQRMITWAEQNMPPEFRRNRPRTRPTRTPYDSR